jgi:hypothetical protein
MTVKQTSRHFLSILMWGAIVVIIDQLNQNVTVLWLIAFRSNRFPLGPHVLEAIKTTNAFIYDIIGIPVMWIRPQSMFASEFWETLIIGLFWGLTLHFTRVLLGLALRYFAKRRYRARHMWSAIDRHDGGQRVH